MSRELSQASDDGAPVTKSGGSRSRTREAAHTPECNHPAMYADEPRSYLGWHAWADRKALTHRQLFCEHCKRWAIWEPRR